MAITEAEEQEFIRRGLVEGEVQQISPPRPLKYRNKPVTTDDGCFFDSTSEAMHWKVLQGREEQGFISGLRRQNKIEVVNSVFWEQAGIFLAPIFWVVDFLYFDVGRSQWIVEDWKSEVTRKLPDYKMKRQLFLLKYPDFLYIETTKEKP